MVWVTDQSIGAAARSLGTRPGIALCIDEASELIHTACDNLDRVFTILCGKYSHFALMVAIQHHVPFLLSFERPDQDGDSQELFNTMSAVAFKFSSPHHSAGIKLTYRQYRRNANRFFDGLGDSLLEDLLLLQLGVRVQRSLMNTKRTVHKGAALQLGDCGKAFMLEYPEEVRKAIGVYENRVWRSVNALGWQGFFVPFASLKNDTTFDFPLARINWDALRTGNGGQQLLDASPLVITLDSLYLLFDGTLFFERQIAAKFGAAVYVTDFFAFLHTIWAPTVERLRQGTPPYGWGYDFWSWRSFRAKVASEAPQSYRSLINLMRKYLDENTPPVLESFSPQYWLRVYRRLLASLSYDSAQRASIQHRNLYPTKFLFTTEQGVFAHLGLFPYFLHALWNEFELTGDIGSQKGPAFEQMAFAFLQSEDLVPVWGPGKPFPFSVGKRVGTDIDLFMRKGKVGFVISCKSYSNTRETYEGERRAVWLRWTEVQSWIKENDELADAMVKHSTTIGIPADIKVLVPMVCVPQVEYLWDTSEHYMLSDDLPRVLTPWELKEWTAGMSEENLLALSCVRTLVD